MSTQPNKLPAHIAALAGNYQRAKRLSVSRAKNLKYGKGLEKFRSEFLIDDDDVNEHLDRYQKSLYRCCSNTLNAVDVQTNHASVKTALYCDHRFCTVCNYQRSQLLRRKYKKFLSNPVQDIVLKKNQYDFFPNNEYATVSGQDILKSLDFMHMTLTVPHTNGTWRGKEYYAAELIQIFNTIRKTKWWNKLVFGGEYCVETTQGKNGLHVHLHCLVFVKREMQNRNKLYTQMFYSWNRHTIDEASKVTEFTEERLMAINTALRSIQPEQRTQMIAEMDARGSTMTGLKSLYHETTETTYGKFKKAEKFSEDGKFYLYSRPGNLKSMERGVMECLKYHFEPCSLENENGEINGPMLCQMLPNVHKKRLYGKFGGLYKVQCLNVQDVSLNDLQEELNDTARDAVPHPYTGMPTEPGELGWVVADACNLIFHDNERHMKINPRNLEFPVRTDIGGYPQNMPDAIRIFHETIYSKRMINHEKEFSKWHGATENNYTDFELEDISKYQPGNNINRKYSTFNYDHKTGYFDIECPFCKTVTRAKMVSRLNVKCQCGAVHENNFSKKKNN